MRVVAKNKTEEFKDFLIAKRKKIGPGLTNAPVWVMQKAGKRIWNPKQKRHWKETDFGDEFRKTEKKLKAHKKKRKMGQKKMAKRGLVKKLRVNRDA